MAENIQSDITKLEGNVPQHDSKNEANVSESNVSTTASNVSESDMSTIASNVPESDISTSANVPESDIGTTAANVPDSGTSKTANVQSTLEGNDVDPSTEEEYHPEDVKTDAISQARLLTLLSDIELIPKAAIRFGKRMPAVPSPLLLDNYDGTIGLVSSPPTDFRVILYVGDYEMEEVCIDFHKDTMAIRMSHDERQMKAGQGLVCKRDSCYYFLLPEYVSKNSLSAQWTDDQFLIIQSRRSQHKEIVHLAERLIPIRIRAVLRPQPNFFNMNSLSRAIVKASEDIEAYLKSSCPKISGEPFSLFPSHLGRLEDSLAEVEKIQNLVPKN